MMIFQWQLFVLLVAIAILTPMFGQFVMVDTYGEKQLHYGWIPVLVLVIPMVYMAGTRSRTVFGFWRYVCISIFIYKCTYITHTYIYLTELFASFTDDTKDKGFEVFTTVVKSIIGNREIVYFTLIAAICVLCVMVAYKNYSCNFIISAFLFIASGDYVQWTLMAFVSLFPWQFYLPVLVSY